MDFRQVFEEKQQLIAVRPISSTFQQMGSIRNAANGNFTGQCQRRLKEAYEAICLVIIRFWVKDKAFNGLLTLVDNQRGRIEVSGAIRIKEEVAHPNWNTVPQEIFVFHFYWDTNQI